MSGLRRSTDFNASTRLVRFVPNAEVTVPALTRREEGWARLSVIFLTFPSRANVISSMRSCPWPEGLMHRHPLLAVFAVLFFGVVAKPAIADNRVALIIGNGAYAHAP